MQMPGVGLHLREGVKRHMLSSIEEWVLRKGYPDFSETVEASPPFSKPLNTLKQLGPWLDFLVEIPEEGLSARYAQIRVLEEAAAILFQRGATGPYDRSALQYIANLAYEFKTQLSEESSHPLRDEQIRALAALVEKIQAWL
jgi:hypothetical protein